MGGGAGAYDDFHVRVAGAHQLYHLGVGGHDVGSRAAPCDIIGAEHEHDHVWLRGREPALEIVVGDADGGVAGVALVVHVPAGVALAVLRVVGHGADELEGVGYAVGLQGVPEAAAPAGYLGDAVAEGHGRVVRDG